MSDQFTETTRTSWFSRLGSAFAGILVGLIAILAGVWLLGWNEGRAVQTERALNEGAGVVQSVSADAVDPAHEGALIHVSGETAVAGPLQDNAWPVSATALRLIRDVEMYQWRETSRSETRTRLGGGEETVTVYEYDRVWSDTAQDSSNFRQPSGHHNPSFPVEAASFTAADATLGAYRLDARIIEQIGSAEALALDETTQAALRNRSGVRATVSATELYLGGNPSDPQVGDTRVRWRAVRPGEVSVVGAQSGDGFAAYRAENGGQVLLVQEGRVSAEEMFAGAQASNRMLLWALRLAGLFILVTGFGLILRPLRVMADVIPPIGAVVGMGLGLVSTLLGVLLGGVVIAIAWFAFRPILSIIVLAVAGAIGFGLWRLGRNRLKRRQAETPEPAPAAGG